MSILKKIFGEPEQKSENRLNWIPLTSIEQLDELTSSNSAIAIFKHSTRCIVSSMAKKQLESSFDLDDTIEMYYLDLITYRNISNEIADRFNIRHESPQLIVLKANKVQTYASHSAISEIELEKYI
ncbi:MAG: hypothetical protein BM563_11880 [Bacteroidetes bacterium MedPE-SWsnd-G1]|nr:MAG: hypothetical protein BM563_11880 [Bacteroidetes bacterium MedPE-SWsnd-G1]